MRLLHIFCALVYLSTGAVSTLCVLDWEHKDPQVTRICGQPSVLRRFEEIRDRRDTPTEKGPPLVVQAQAFASYLNGSPVQSKRQVVAAQQLPPRGITKAAKVRVVPSAKFTLEGTSYYESQPDRSIALIGEPGSPERNQRWVKEGAAYSHNTLGREPVILPPSLRCPLIACGFC